MKMALLPTGPRVAEARKLMSLSQAQMAQRLGLSVQSYGRYERGERELPSAALTAFAEMGISVTWLLTGMGEPMADARATKVGEVSRQLESIEEDLNRAQAPVAVDELVEGSRLKELYRQLVELAGNASIAEDRARAAMLLDVGFVDPAADGRRRTIQVPMTDTFQRRLKGITEVYTGILKDLDWTPPAMTGMAVRDAMIIDGLSDEMARFILAALKEDLLKTETAGGKQ